MTEATALEKVRIDLLVGLKMMVDEGKRIRRDSEAGVVEVHTGRVSNPDFWPQWTPLYVGTDHDPEDWLLAAKEASRLGELEMDWSEFGPSIRLTDHGYEVATRLQWRHYPKSVRSEPSDRVSSPDSAVDTEADDE